MSRYADLFDKVSLDQNATNFVGQIAGPLTAPWPTLRKVAAEAVEAQERGTESRRKAKKRGFYTDPAPGMYGVRSAFQSAAKNDGKLAALQHFGVLHGKGDPVKGLTELFRKEDFGLARRASRDKISAGGKNVGTYTCR